MRQPRKFSRKWYTFQPFTEGGSRHERCVAIYCTTAGPQFNLSTARYLRDWLNEVIEWMEEQEDRPVS